MGAVPILAAVLGGAAASKAMKKEEKPAEAASPATEVEKPTTEDTQAKALADIKKRRRTSMLRGGMTDLTGGSALVNQSNVGTKALLGA